MGECGLCGTKQKKDIIVKLICGCAYVVCDRCNNFVIGVNLLKKGE